MSGHRGPRGKHNDFCKHRETPAFRCCSSTEPARFPLFNLITSLIPCGRRNEFKNFLKAPGLLKSYEQRKSPNLHTTLAFGVGTTEFGFVEAVYALAAVVFCVAAFANATPPRPITERPESLPLNKARWLLDLSDLQIRQPWTVRL